MLNLNPQNRHDNLNRKPSTGLVLELFVGYHVYAYIRLHIQGPQ